MDELRKITLQQLFDCEKDWHKTVVFKDLPTDIGEEKFLLFLESVVDDGNFESLCQWSEGSQAAMVVFKEPIGDVVKYHAALKKRKLKGNLILMEKLGTMRGVFLSRLPPLDDIQGYLTLYFESKRKCGASCDVKDVKCSLKGTCAAVVIHDVEDIKMVLRQKTHIMQDTTVTVEPYFPPYHDFIIDRALEETTYTDNEESDEPDLPQQEKSGRKIIGTIEKSAERINPFHTDEAKVIFKEKTSAKFFDNTSQSCQKEKLGTCNPYVPQPVPCKQPVCLLDLVVEVGDQSDPEPDQTLPERKHTPERSLEASSQPRFQPKPQPRESGLRNNQQNPNILQKQPFLYGAQEAAASFGNPPSQQRYPTSPESKPLYAPKLPTQTRYIESFCREKADGWNSSETHVAPERRKAEARVPPFITKKPNQEVRRQIEEKIKLVKVKLQSRSVKLRPGQVDLVRGEKWSAFMESLNKEEASVFLSSDQCNIIVESLKDKVAEKMRKKVIEFLKRNVVKVTKVIELNGAKAKCFNRCLRQALEKIIKEKQGTMDVKVVKPDYPMKLSLNVQGEESVIEETERVLGQIWHERIDFSKVTNSDEWLLMRGLNGEHGRPFFKGFQKEHNCFIDVIPEGQVQPPAMQTIHNEVTWPAQNLREDSQEDLETSLARKDTLQKEPRSNFDKSLYQSSKMSEKEALNKALLESVEVGSNEVSGPAPNLWVENQEDWEAALAREDTLQTKPIYDFKRSLCQSSKMSYKEALNKALLESEEVGSNEVSGPAPNLRVENQEDWEAPLAREDTLQTEPIYDFKRSLYQRSKMSEKEALNKALLESVEVGSSNSPVFDRRQRRSLLVESSMPKIQYDEDCDQDFSYTIRMNNSPVTLQKGAVEKFKAECLVSIVGPKGDLGEGAVSKALLKVGGMELNTSFHNERAKHGGKVVDVRACGGLRQNCQRVVHVTLQEHVDDCSQEIQNVMGQVFQLCERRGLKSLAIPPLGVGHMYQYPPSTVAQTMLHATQNFLSTNPSMVVTFVVFDSKTFSGFKREFESWEGKQGLCGTRQRPISWQTHSSPMIRFQRESHPRKSYDDQREKVKAPRQQSRFPNESSVKKLTVVVYAESKDRCIQARTQLCQAMRNTFLFQEEFAKAKNISKEAKEKMVAIITKYKVKSVKAKNVYVIKGQMQDVNSAIKEMYQVLLAAGGQAENSERDSRSHRAHSRPGTVEYMKYHIEEGPDVPHYWKHFKPGTPVRRAFTDVKLYLKRKNHIKVTLKKTDPAYASILNLINKTWDAAKRGQGKDATGLDRLHYKRMHVTDIQRIENFELYVKYADKRNEYFRYLMRNNLSYYPRIENLKRCTGKIKSLEYMDKILKEDLNPGINELYFFHGTKLDKTEVICEKGLDNRVASDNAMFGQGIYGAESPSKADQYADDKAHRTMGHGEPKQMFLMRMILGNAYLCTNPNPEKYKVPPCVKCYSHTCIDHSDNFNSVVGDNGKLFREFVVYDKGQCYPEYLITYIRLP